MDISGRLERFREHLGLTISQMADKAGIPRPTLWQFLNGRNKTLRDDMTSKLHQTFPSLNILWLLFGEGEMELNSNIEISASKNEEFYEGCTGQQPDSKHYKSEFCADLFSQIHSENSESQTINAKNRQISHIDNQQEPPPTERPAIPPTSPPSSTIALQPDNSKRIQTIMVFYNDNSFEIFRPSDRDDQ